jgi:polyphosphate kinase
MSSLDPSLPVSPDNDPLRDPALYINRELSQLDFNFRVLAQAMDPQVPLLERLRFMCISCTNLDEFFEIRAAAVRHAQESACRRPGRMSPQAILTAIHDRARSWWTSSTAAGTRRCARR